MTFALERQGSLIRHAVTNPAAGANFSLTLDPVFHAILHAVTFQLVTDANVANRYANIIITPPTAEVLSCATAVAHVASSTVVYTYWEGWPHTGAIAVNRCTLPLPNAFFVPRGSLIGSDIRQIQATDQLSNIVLWFRKWGGAS